MQPGLHQQLAALGPLEIANRRGPPCKLCGCTSEFFDVVDFNKYCSEQNPYTFGRSGVAVAYYRCPRCEFVFTDFFDDWTTEEFARFVYNDDYIKVDGEYAGARPRRVADRIAKRLGRHFRQRILDYGSGSGLFEAQLRTHGFVNVTSYDPFSSPARPAGRYDIITCFEVLEHTPTPARTLADIASLLAPGGCVLFGTGLQPPDIGRLRGSWWYIAPRNGHVSIYSHRSLAIAGRRAGLTLHASAGDLAFGGARPSPVAQKMLGLVGRPTQFFELTAPLKGEDEAGWNVAEGRDAETFRWTKAREIVWRVQEDMLAPCELMVSVPFRAEVQRGFAGGCELLVGGRTVPLTRGVGTLSASVTLEEAAEPVIRLITPEPLRPCDLRPVKDARLIGLAVMMAR
jgi:2-polyprenyl-6-hydroxyphenyl methylase/3-demethylubiquinone-9 3-methyltransferase